MLDTARKPGPQEGDVALMQGREQEGRAVAGEREYPAEFAGERECPAEFAGVVTLSARHELRSFFATPWASASPQVT